MKYGSVKNMHHFKARESVSICLPITASEISGVKFDFNLTISSKCHSVLSPTEMKVHFWMLPLWSSIIHWGTFTQPQMPLLCWKVISSSVNNIIFNTSDNTDANLIQPRHFPLPLLMTQIHIPLPYCRLDWHREI